MLNGKITRLRLQNARTEACRVRLEPWAEEFSVAPGESCDLVAEGPDNGFLELVFETESIDVYGWTGSVLTVLRKNGSAIDCRPAVPPIPSNPVAGG